MPREMIKRLWSRRPRVVVGTAAVPEGVRVYAVGDIHGCSDLLRQLHARILADAASLPAGTRSLAIYLGDYVDRGLHSREVLDLLIDEPLPGFESVHLRGNHDHELLAFLNDPGRAGVWLRYGGDATLYSYGLRIPMDVPPDARAELLSEQLREAMPQRHVDFLNSLPLAYEVGDYFFAHAGVDPDKALDRQSAEDLMWIRDQFLEADCDLEKVVVHGHSVTAKPDVRDNRIGIDTGACFTRSLSCVVLEGKTQRFISTSDLNA